MSKHEESRLELHKELEKGLGQRGTIMLMEELQAIRQDVQHLSLKIDAMDNRMDNKMDAMEAKLEARYLRTILMVNVPSILGAVGLAFAATRLG
jgi:hypothetical protein